MNPTLLIDGYKLDHRRQYPANTEYVYSNLTARGSRIPGQTHVPLLGLQYFLLHILGEQLEEFFAADVETVAQRYTDRVNGYLGPNAIGTEHIRAWHALGYTPLEFRAVPEGTKVPLRVAMLTVTNTHPDFAWLVNYYETILSATLWMPCTSAATALRCRRLLEAYADRTGTPREFVQWQGHDFSFRGMPGLEAACLSGIGHLAAFTGSDTMPAIDFIEQYYPVLPGTLIAGSVAATEHSVMCAGGESTERATYERLLDLYPTGIVSVVSDTWDLWKVLTETLPSLKDKIMARDGKLVIRPDSGDPVKIICGDPKAPWGSPESHGVVDVLWEIFGGTHTSTGHRQLDSHIGVIYGDSISWERMEAILNGLDRSGYASGNIVFGMGSYTYQYVTRDTHNFAMKATWVQIAGKAIDIYKDPKTDNGLKTSARGRIAALRDEAGELYQVDQAPIEQELKSELGLVWRDGTFWRVESFNAIRERLLAA